MDGLSLHVQATRKGEPLDLAAEAARIEQALAKRRAELSVLQAEFQQFKAHYTQLIGSRLAELAEVERAIKEAEAGRLGIETTGEKEEEADAAAEAEQQQQAATPVGKGLRKLFWSVAKLFHPDMASDEDEARRRHAVMVEASRAYREGDIESLSTLLGDEELHFFCASSQLQDAPADLAGRIIMLKEELRTVEFGIRRILQDGLYQLKLRADEAALSGRDSLAQQAEQLNRQINKARRRLAHLS